MFIAEGKSGCFDVSSFFVNINIHCGCSFTEAKEEIKGEGEKENAAGGESKASIADSSSVGSDPAASSALACCS